MINTFLYSSLCVYVWVFFFCILQVICLIDFYISSKLEHARLKLETWLNRVIYGICLVKTIVTNRPHSIFRSTLSPDKSYIVYVYFSYRHSLSIRHNLFVFFVFLFTQCIMQKIRPWHQQQWHRKIYFMCIFNVDRIVIATISKQTPNTIHT